MNWPLIGGITCIAYSAVTLYVAAAKPAAVWNIDKIQALVQSLGDTGATMFVGGWGLVAGGAGVYLLAAF